VFKMTNKNLKHQAVAHVRDYVSELWPPTVHSPDDIWVWRATVEWHWQGKTKELRAKHIPVPLCPPQIPHGLTQVQTWTSTVRGQWLTTWAMVWPKHQFTMMHNLSTKQNISWSCHVISFSFSKKSFPDKLFF
jgi:hypothetical protein